MKYLFTLLFVGLFWGSAWSQCPSFPYLSSQQQVDDFPAMYPNCTQPSLLVIGGSMNNSDINDLTPLNQLVSATTMTIRETALISLAGLENITSIGSLNIIDNDSLTSLTGLGSLTSVSAIMMIHENDALITLTGLESLNHVNHLRVWNNNALTSLTGLENLNSIPKLFISSNDNLIDLTSLQNVDYNSIIFGLTIKNNGMLNVCSLPNICNYLVNGGENQIEGNGLDCIDYTTVLDNCSNLTKIQSQIFNDLNQNGVRDTDEPDLYDINISIDPDSSVLLTEISTGIFYVEPGSYLATYKQTANPNWTLSTDSSSYFLSLDEGVCDTITFGLYPTQIISQAPVITSPPTGCNETLTFDISFRNLDTVVLSGTLWVEIDDNILATNFIDMPDTMVIPDRYGWFFDTLSSNDDIIKKIELQLPGPPNFSEGNALTFYAYVDFEGGNGTLNSPIFTYTPEVNCSYTSNDKLVHPSRIGDYVLFEENLIYTIRFQNTSNSIVDNVIIRDTLDAHFALETFRLLSSSHNAILNTNLSAEGVLTFEFNDIALPDATSNFEGSHGYVTYLIRTNDGVADATLVTNSASIYFDLNPSVATNTTQSFMVNALPALPVEMTTPLQVRLQNRTAVLTWRTETETNNSGFEIQRSKDGIKWEKIGWQNGQGTTTTPHSYAHRDTTPLPGTSYYRLKQVDFDSQFEYSNIVSLRYDKPEGITVYPIPSKDVVIFDVPNIAAADELILYNISGKQISRQAFRQDKKLAVSHLNDGVYIYRIFYENEVYSGKIVVE